MAFISSFGRRELESELEAMAENLNDSLRLVIQGKRPFASAPIRSRPRRTYDPTRPSRDPEGENTPTYLAEISQSNKKEWARLKNALEDLAANQDYSTRSTLSCSARLEELPSRCRSASLATA